MWIMSLTSAPSTRKFTTKSWCCPVITAAAQDQPTRGQKTSPGAQLSGTPGLQAASQKASLGGEASVSVMRQGKRDPASSTDACARPSLVVRRRVGFTHHLAAPGPEQMPELTSHGPHPAARPLPLLPRGCCWPSVLPSRGPPRPAGLGPDAARPLTLPSSGARAQPGRRGLI